MNKQYPLELPHQPTYAEADFLHAGCNEAARDLLDDSENWPNYAACIWGLEGAGKTHLAQIWARRVGAEVIDLNGLEVLDFGCSRKFKIVLDLGIEKLPAAQETKLFHLLNFSRETRGGLLIVSRDAPARWSVALPDLMSRLRALRSSEVLPPDDGLFAAVLAKQLADRQLVIDKATINYLLLRAERSFATARELSARLDRAALARRSGITIPLARSVLVEMQKDLLIQE